MSIKINHVLTQGFIAGGTIAKNRLVKWDSTDGQVVAAGDGDPVVGVALNAASSGAPVDVCVFGIAYVEAGGSISQNAVIGAGSAGVAAAISLGTSSADNDVAGVAYSAASTSGDLIAVFIGKNPIAVNA